jgi:hypothetical protein
VGFSQFKDETILHLYDNIRIQVEADRSLRYKFMTSVSVKQRASALREEITIRHLQHTPIEWPRDI